MLKKHAQLFESLFTATDLLVVSCAWLFSYWIRFHSGYFVVDKGVPPFSDYLKMLIFVWFIWGFVFKRFGLYRAMRRYNRFKEAMELVKANALSIILFLSVTYLFREKDVEFSRLVFVVFVVVSTGFLLMARSFLRKILRAIRKNGLNQRHAIIVGSEGLAAEVAKRIHSHPEYGIELRGCLCREPQSLQGRARIVANSPVSLTVSAEADSSNPHHALSMQIIGSYADLPEILARGGVDQVIVALPLRDHDQMESIMDSIGDAMVDVRVIPDFYQFIKLGSLVEDFDGLPAMSIVSTPLMGINRVYKRIMDLVLGTVFFLMASPVMLVVALLVKLTSRGPIFYKQERMGLDGNVFNILKFRTMYTNAESRGARFARKHDPRVTPLGKILRKLNIDELPQLLNVILGHMSLVGPRPERPVFIEDFRHKFPKYMLRHKVQAGLTGWAQVNGWRGNTSIEKRVECDLYYIENWSLLFDLKIILLTFVRGFTDENAY